MKYFIILAVIATQFITNNSYSIEYNPAIGLYTATKGNNLDIGILTQHAISEKKGALLINLGGGFIPRMHRSHEGEILIGIGYLQRKIQLPVPIAKIQTVYLGWSIDMTQRFSSEKYNGMTLTPTFNLGINKILIGISIGYQYDPQGYYFLDKHSTFGRISMSYLFGKNPQKKSKSNN